MSSGRLRRDSNVISILPSSSTTHQGTGVVDHNVDMNDSSAKPSMGRKDANKPVTWMSLPHKPQLFILALCRLSESLSNTCLLPYLYYLMRSLQSPSSSTSSSISRQGGLLVALFALAQFATSMPWAYVANRYGRKTSIMVGLVLSIISNLGFGFSKTIPAVMCWRVVAGIGNGNIGVMRTMTAEIVKEKRYQGRAFLLLPLVFNSGVVVGLALGGCLADPVTNLPSLFGPQGIFNSSNNPDGVSWMLEYPFALPTIFNGAVLTGSLLLAVCGLKETMPGRTERKDYGLVLGRAVKRLLRRLCFRGRTSGYMAVQMDDQDTTEHSLVEHNTKPPNSSMQTATQKPLSSTPLTSQSIWTRDVLYMLVSFALLPLHNAAFMQIFPIFLSTPVSEVPASSLVTFNGGLGLPSSTIGLFLSAFGIFGILIQLFIYPRMQASMGTLWSYRLALSMFPFAYIMAPYLTLMPTATRFPIQGFGIAFILFLQVMARTFAIPSSVILLTNSAPTPMALGNIHGAGNMWSSLSRAVGPAVGGLVFAWGVDMGVVGFVWWSYLTIVAVGGLAWSWKLKEGEGFSLRRRKDSGGGGKVDIELSSVRPSRAVSNEDDEKIGKADHGRMASIKVT
jgi:hypothetical protein